MPDDFSPIVDFKMKLVNQLMLPQEQMNELDILTNPLK